MALFSFKRTPTPDLAGTRSLAYVPGLAPTPPFLISGRGGRFVARSLAPLEGAYYSTGQGPVRNAIDATSLGMNRTPGLAELAKKG